MSRPLIVVPLALLQTATLLVGVAAALRPVVQPVAPVAVAPVVRAVDPALPQPLPAAHLTTAAPVRAQAQLRPRPVPPLRHTPAHIFVRRTAKRALHIASVPFQVRLMQAVARIPGYRQGDATWFVTPGFGHWGVADLYHDVIYISPTVPSERLYDVAVHEWSHLLSVRDYGGQVHEALDAFNSWYGGTHLVGAERAADCMARALGAVWTHYTPCTDPRWQLGARRLVAGQQL